MRHIKTFDQKYSSQTYPENWNKVKSVLDENTKPLDYPELTYIFADLIDDEVIEIGNITKLYKLQKAYSKDGGDTKNYGIIVYDVEIKILNLDRLKEYIEYRDNYAKNLIDEYYGYTLLNGWGETYFSLGDKNKDEFNLWSGAVWVDNV